MIGFCLLLINHHRLPLLSEILKKFELLKDQHQGVLRARVEVPQATPEQASQHVKESFSKAIQQKIIWDDQNNGLIAGFKVTVDDVVFEASLDNSLKNYKKYWQPLNHKAREVDKACL